MSEPDYSTASFHNTADWPPVAVNTSAAADPNHTSPPVAQCFAPQPCTCPTCGGPR